MHTFPKRCAETIGILVKALAADPRAIEPLLDLTNHTYRGTCI
jgi:hypothetical protein